jgi:hypothetical protein
LTTSLALLLLAGCAAPGVCLPPRQLSEIPLLRLGHEEIVPVELAGQPAGLLLDTGSNATTITPQAMSTLGPLQVVGSARAAGIGGEARVPVLALSSLKVGAASVIDPIAALIPLSSLPLDRYPVFGLLGQDILSHWDLDLDVAHDRLALYAPQHCAVPSAPWPGPVQPVHMAWAGASMGDQVTMSLDDHRVIAKLDTGASATIVTESAAGLDDRALANDPTALENGVLLQPVKTRRHRFRDFTIGTASYGPTSLDVTDTMHSGDDMLLGEDFLDRHRVFIAFHDHMLLIAP